MKVKIKIKSDSKRVGKAVIFENNKVLLLKRSDYLEKHKGEWDLPGGHIHKGEKTKVGMMREVKEETSLDLENATFAFQEKKDFFYFCELPKGEIKLSDEHTEWVLKEFEEIKNLEGVTPYYSKAIKKCYKARNKLND